MSKIVIFSIVLIFFNLIPYQIYRGFFLDFCFNKNTNHPEFLKQNTSILDNLSTGYFFHKYRTKNNTKSLPHTCQPNQSTFVTVASPCNAPSSNDMNENRTNANEELRFDPFSGKDLSRPPILSSIEEAQSKFE